MAKYIDADRLKKAVEHELDMQDLYLPVHFFEVVDGMEAADVQEVKHGRWEKKNVSTDFDGEVFNVEHIVCSVCEAAIPLCKIYKRDWYSDYCPSCGAKMDEVSE